MLLSWTGCAPRGSYSGVRLILWAIGSRDKLINDPLMAISCRLTRVHMLNSLLLLDLELQHLQLVHLQEQVLLAL